MAEKNITGQLIPGKFLILKAENASQLNTIMDQLSTFDSNVNAIKADVLKNISQYIGLRPTRTVPGYEFLEESKATGPKM